MHLETPGLSYRYKASGANRGLTKEKGNQTGGCQLAGHTYLGTHIYSHAPRPSWALLWKLSDPEQTVESGKDKAGCCQHTTQARSSSTGRLDTHCAGGSLGDTAWEGGETHRCRVPLSCTHRSCIRRAGAAGPPGY